MQEYFIFPEQAKERIRFLIDQINQANYEYYNLNQSNLTDQQYDALFKELLFLESKYPEYRFSFSPTTKVGGFLSKKFIKTLHSQPMFSLNNVFNLSDLNIFYKRIGKRFTNFTLVTELKIDGLAVSFQYKKGILKRAITRGNGIEGELVTDNIKTIRSLPLKLKDEIDLEVRGEVYMTNTDFQKLNDFQKNKNQVLFANPRNAASGTLRQLDSKIVAQRNLSVFIYSIVEPPYFIQTQIDVLEFLIKNDFPVNTYYEHIINWNNLVSKIDEYSALQNNLDYNTDGVVVKINELKLQSLIGYTSKAPKWAIAYKFQLFKAETMIQDITFQIGRTGILTPIAQLMPVIIAGSLISRVTLHNYEYIQKKDIRINDFVLIHKSGDVIPKIFKVLLNKRTNQKTFCMIQSCPCCNTALIKQEMHYFCPNINCSEQNIQKLFHFVSKQALNINTLGLKTLIFLFSKGFIKKNSDLYYLHRYKGQIIKLHNFGEKKINNILSEIEKSKNKCLTNILIGLGIKNVGVYLAKILAKRFKNIDNLKNASVEQLSKINFIGYQVAQNIRDFFLNIVNLEEIENLKKVGFTFNYIIKKRNKINIFLNNKKVVFTGVFSNYTRKDIRQITENLGAIVLNDVSNKIDYLIAGVKPGSKLLKAQKLNISIIQEDEFIKNIQ